MNQRQNNDVERLHRTEAAFVPRSDQEAIPEAAGRRRDGRAVVSNRPACLRAIRQAAGLLPAVLALCLPAAAAPSTRDEAPPPALRRWAILCSADQEASGLCDLLTAELSAREDLVLLERSRLRTLLSEMTLADFLGDDGTARLKLNRLLNADALVVAVGDGAAKIRVTIADCRSGARLHVQEFSAGPAHETAGKIDQVVGMMLRRFPEGVRRVIGVSGFVSRNLVHDYDTWQTRYADLLAHALSLEPGVAVIATEHARAIGQELGGNNEPVADRVVPMILEGAFRMSGGENGGPLSVAFTVRVRHGAASRVIESGKLAMDTAPKWVAVELPGLLAATGAEHRRLTVEQQCKALTEQAGAFGRLGAYTHATGLREAAILLKPDLVEQRLSCIEEYRRLSQDPLNVQWHEQQRRNPRLAAEVERRVNAYIAALEHFEYLIRTGRIEGIKAVELAEKLTTQSLLSSMYYVVPNDGADYWRVGQEQLAKAEEAEAFFMTEVYPKVLSLPLGNIRREREAQKRYRFLELYSRPLREAAKLRVDRTYMTKGDLRFLAGVWTEIMPDGIEVANQALPVPQGGGTSVPVRPDEAGAADFDAFLGKLAAGGHGVASIQGRYALYYRRWRAEKENRDAMRTLLPEVDRLLDDYAQLPYAHGTSGEARGRTNEYMYGRVRDLRNYVFKAAGLESEPTRDSSPATAYRPSTKPKPEPTTGALRFEAVGPFRLQRRIAAGTAETQPQASGHASPVRNVTRAGEQLDIYWGEHVVLFMRQPGVLEEALKVPTTDVVWDGAYVWVATRRAGLHILDADGTTVGRIGPEQGLPPIEHACRLHALAPGRVVAIGSFGKHMRGWCAVVKWKEGEEAEVHVFHEATRVDPSAGNTKKDERLPDLVFEPCWVHAYRAKGEHPDPMLLVGRQASLFRVRRDRPLLINLKTFNVSVFDLSLGRGDMANEHSFFSSGGRLVQVGQHNTTWFAPPGEAWPDGKPYRGIPLVNPAPVNRQTGWLDDRDEVELVRGAGEARRMLKADDGYLYVPGMWWYRIDPKTMTGERLTSQALPPPYRNISLAVVTSHYGILVSPGHSLLGALYRVTVDEAAIPGAGDPMSY